MKKITLFLCMSIMPALYSATSEKCPLVLNQSSSHPVRLSEEKRLELVDEIVASQTSLLSRNISKKQATDATRKAKIQQLFYPNGAWDSSEDCAKKLCVRKIRDDVNCTESCNILSGCGMSWCTLISLAGLGVIFSDNNIGSGMIMGGIDSAGCCLLTFVVNDMCRPLTCCDRCILDHLSNPDMWQEAGEDQLDAPQQIEMREFID